MSKHSMTEEERQATLAEFRRVVNMTPAALRHWLGSVESRSVGMTPDGERVTGPEGHGSEGHGSEGHGPNDREPDGHGPDGHGPDGHRSGRHASNRHESVGHHMGERIVEIKARKPTALTDDDYHDMRKVVGYVHRHMAQRPDGDVEDTRWRKSLMNWGHDPLRDDPS